MKIELSNEMLDFFLLTMKAKKKRLLSFEPEKNYSPYSQVGMITVKWEKGNKEDREQHQKARQDWELKMNRTERAIDILEEVKEKATPPQVAHY